ncbi:hypothetical protein BDQ17DRAFT_1212291, partial [Cyathus striatus]
YKFTYDDYVSYIEICKAFLNSPHGHAALLMGGIVRRIAREHLSFNGALHSPSSSV